jgi:hypothetical protein
MIDMKKNSGDGPGSVNENIFQGKKKFSYADQLGMSSSCLPNRTPLSEKQALLRDYMGHITGFPQILRR